MLQRGQFYRVFRGNKNDPKNNRVFVVVSRQTVIDSKFSTVVCAPVYSRYDGLSSQLEVGIAEGLKKSSCIFCEELISIEKTTLTDFVGTLSSLKLAALSQYLKIALDLD